MKILTAIALLFSTLCAFGQPWTQTDPAMSGTAAASGGTAYLFTENFNAWTNTTRNNSAPYSATYNNWYILWTDSSNPASTVDMASTSGLSLEGSQCLAIVDPGGDHPITRSPSFSGEQSECWVRFRFRAASSMNGYVLFRLQDSGNNTVGSVKITGGSLTIYQGTTSDATADAPSADASYYVWVHYKSDGSASVAFAATNSRPTEGSAFKSVTGGDATGSVAKVAIHSYSSSTFYFDDILVNSGNNPTF